MFPGDRFHCHAPLIGVNINHDHTWRWRSPIERFMWLTSVASLFLETKLNDHINIHEIFEVVALGFRFRDVSIVSCIVHSFPNVQASNSKYNSFPICCPFPETENSGLG
jgi:hypothetical protein